MEEKRILIIEDEPSTAKLEEVILQHDGYIVDIAENAAEAFVKLAEKEYSLILTDINMPGIDGFELTEKLLEPNSPYKHIPVVIVTTRRTEEDMARGFEVGAVTYLTKPFSSKALLTTVKLMLPPPDQKRPRGRKALSSFKPTVSSAKKKK